LETGRLKKQSESFVILIFVFKKIFIHMECRNNQVDQKSKKNNDPYQKTIFSKSSKEISNAKEVVMHLVSNAWLKN